MRVGSDGGRDTLAVRDRNLELSGPHTGAEGWDSLWGLSIRAPLSPPRERRLPGSLPHAGLWAGGGADCPSWHSPGATGPKGTVCKGGPLCGQSAAAVQGAVAS